jgi:uncharacterized protein
MIAERRSVVMHAGDYCSPFTLRRSRSLRAACSASSVGTTVIAMGCARPRSRLRCGALRIAAQLRLGGQRILLVHDITDVHERSIDSTPSSCMASRMSGDEDARETLLVNPGEACGWLYGAPRGAILDLETKAGRVHQADGPEWKV